MTAHTTSRPSRLSGQSEQTRRRGHLPVSWTLLLHRARLLASYLDRAGVRPGDRVAIDVPAGPALTALTYACWQSGLTVVVSDPDLTSRQRTAAFATAAPAAIVATSPGLRGSRSIPSVRVRVAAEPLTVVARAVLHTGWDQHELVDGSQPHEHASLPAPLEAAVVVGQDDEGRPSATTYSHADLVGLATA